MLLYAAVSPLWDRLPAPLQIALNFTLISFGWAFFMFDLSGAMTLFASLLGWHSEPDIAVAGWAWLLVLVAFGLVQFVYPEKLAGSAANTQSIQLSVALGVGMAALAMLTLTFIDVSDTFIYFRF